MKINHLLIQVNATSQVYQIAFGHKNVKSKINISLTKKILAFCRGVEKLEALLYRKNQGVLKALTYLPKLADKTC